MTLRQREPRVECPAFLAFVRRRPCCACGAPAPSQAAHVRLGEPRIGKRNTGIGEKPSDRWCVPLCADCHLDSPNAQHRVGERVFWVGVGLNPFKLAMTLYAQFERRRARSPEQREKVVRRAKRLKRSRSIRFPKSPAQVKRATDSRPKPRPPKRKWASRPFPAGRKLRSHHGKDAQA